LVGTGRLTLGGAGWFELGSWQVSVVYGCSGGVCVLLCRTAAGCLTLILLYSGDLGVFMSWLSLFTLFMQVRRVLVNVAVLPLLVWTAWPVGFVCLFTLLCQGLFSSILGSVNMVATIYTT